ncbi:MAG: isochorismatase family protein [Myxococcales bacterium]|nr:isochorismatase family protein [Myxococcales bacterium]
MLAAPLDPSTLALLIIDVQDRLVAAMPAEVAATVERNLITLAAAAERFALPVIVSEQYPKGLGRTTAAVAGALEAVRGVCFFEKIEFAACAAPAWAEAVGPDPRKIYLVTGMETHVCVFQTVRALRGAGHEVIVLADAVASRTERNWQTGLDLCRQTGALIATTEMVVFDLLGKAGTDDFKALSRLLR